MVYEITTLLPGEIILELEIISYLTVKGDTVYKYQYAYRYRDKLIRDTISVSKTDSIPYPVKGDTIYINKLNWYQNLSVWGFSIILGAIIIYIILKIKNIKLPL